MQMKSFGVVLCVLLSIEVGLPGAHAMAGAPPTQKLTIFFAGCPADRTTSTLRLQIGHSTYDTIYHREWKNAHYAFLRNFGVTLPPGFYNVFVGNDACSDSLQVTVLKGHNLEVFATGRSTVYFGLPHASVAGTLPMAGSNVSIVYDFARDAANVGPVHLEIPASVQGNTYYAGALPNGQPALRIYNQTRTAWADFDLGKIDASHRHRIFNVSLRMLEASEAAAATKHH